MIHGAKKDVRKGSREFFLIASIENEKIYLSVVGEQLHSWIYYLKVKQKVFSIQYNGLGGF